MSAWAMAAALMVGMAVFMAKRANRVQHAFAKPKGAARKVLQ